MPASETAPEWAAVVINYEAGSALSECVRSLLADESVPAIFEAVPGSSAVIRAVRTH